MLAVRAIFLSPTTSKNVRGLKSGFKFEVSTHKDRNVSMCECVILYVLVLTTVCLRGFRLDLDLGLELGGNDEYKYKYRKIEREKT